MLLVSPFSAPFIIIMRDSIHTDQRSDHRLLSKSNQATSSFNDLDTVVDPSDQRHSLPLASLHLGPRMLTTHHAHDRPNTRRKNHLLAEFESVLTRISKEQFF